MRVCITGPSHLAALRIAERTGLVDTSAHDITYFGHASVVLQDVALQDGRLFIDSVRGARPLAEDLLVDVQASDFDLFFYHTAVNDYPRMLRRIGMNVADVRKYSADVVTRALTKSIESFRPFRFAQELRAAFGGPIFVSSVPMKANPQAEGAAGDGNTGPDTELLALLAKRTAAALTPMGFHYVPQPAETVFGWNATRNEFSVGSKPLGERKLHQSDDNHHMNEKYGALVYQAFLDQVSALGEQDRNTGT